MFSPPYRGRPARKSKKPILTSEWGVAYPGCRSRLEDFSPVQRQVVLSQSTRLLSAPCDLAYVLAVEDRFYVADRWLYQVTCSSLFRLRYTIEVLHRMSSLGAFAS